MRKHLWLAGAAALAVGLAAVAPRAAAQPEGMATMAPMGLPPGSQFNSDSLTFEGGVLHAEGNVTIRSDDYNLDCDDLVFDEENSQMIAEGETVQLQIGNLTAVGTHLLFNTETGDMTIERQEGDESQPYIVQEGDESTFTASADRIVLGRSEDGEPIFTLEGHVRTRSVSNNPEQSRAAPPMFEPIEISLPGLGDDAELLCDALDYSAAAGRLTALGDVGVVSEAMSLDCEELVYTEETGQMIAVGEEVLVRREGVDARCTRLNYLVESERIFLERRNPQDAQPEVWQQRETDVFHARADLITLTTTAEGRTRVNWHENVVLESIPLASPPEEPTETPQMQVRRVESIDDIPGLLVDPTV